MIEKNVFYTKSALRWPGRPLVRSRMTAIGNTTALNHMLTLSAPVRSSISDVSLITPQTTKVTKRVLPWRLQSRGPPLTKRVSIDGDPGDPPAKTLNDRPSLDAILMKRVRSLVRSYPGPYAAYGAMRYALHRGDRVLYDLVHHWRPAAEDGLALPPPKLRHRVGGSFGSKKFIQIGRDCAATIRQATQEAGQDLYGGRSVLDFSCGCGRVIRHFKHHPPQLELHGCDVDGDAIAWCQNNLGSFATFQRTGYEPPLPYLEGAFDTIYVVSLFTHLDERLQFLWLAELQRVLAPRGLLIATVHGRFGQRYLPDDDHQRLDETGFFFQTGQTGAMKLDGLPDYYQAAYHTEAYVRQRWSQNFDLVAFKEQGLNNDQDLVVLRKRA